jgi:hypothetical protein
MNVDRYKVCAYCEGLVKHLPRKHAIRNQLHILQPIQFICHQLAACRQANPADEYMDIITGLVAPRSATGTRSGPADLAATWAAHCAAHRRRADNNGFLAGDEVSMLPGSFCCQVHSQRARNCRRHAEFADCTPSSSIRGLLQQGEATRARQELRLVSAHKV